jgi:hypothetical protein
MASVSPGQVRAFPRARTATTIPTGASSPARFLPASIS